MVDLHLHTTASDGTLTPAALMAECDRCGVDIMAITDHDTCAGAVEARAHACAYPAITLLQGVEIGARLGVEVHILGYGVDGGAPSLRALFEWMHERRVERHYIILENLNRLGIRIDMPPGVNPGRIQVAYELVRLGAAPDMYAAMNRYLGEGGAAYAPLAIPVPSEAIRAIREAGGVAVWAHPANVLGPRPSAEQWTLLRALMDSGLRGMECYHSTCAPETARMLRGVAEREGLLITGGSDFHGANKRGVDILTGLEAWRDAQLCARRLMDAMAGEA